MGREAADGDFIFHIQHGFISPGQLADLLPRARFLARLIHPRQIDGKGRPLPHFALDGDISPALLDDSVAGRQSQPGALPLVFRGEKWLEDLLLHFRRNAHAGVADRELHVIPRGHLIGGIEVVQEVGDVRRFDGDRPPLGIASRAFTQRFKSTCSIWPGSAFIRPISAANFVLILTSSPITRSSIFSIFRTASFILKTRRNSGCRRLKASS